MTTCRIQWIDAYGKPTPDTNPAIGEVWLPTRVVQIDGRGVPMEASERFPICAHHAKRLTDLGMGEWHFWPYPAQSVESEP